MIERGGGIGIVSEPYRISEENSNWFADDTKSAAIVWRSTQDIPPCTLVEKRRGIVVADWRGYTIVSVYVSPRLTLHEYENWLEELSECVQRRPARPKIVAGDFNARSQSWGDSLTNNKGKAVEDWAAQNSLVLINQGSVSTCVRQRGESIDLTWVSPMAARKIRDWKVAEEIETLSDHRAIEFSIQDAPQANAQEKRPNRWATKKMDTDKLRAVLEASTWTQEWSNLNSIEEMVKWLQQILIRACDVSMPRVRDQSKMPVYWWSEEIAQLRKTTVRANRLLSRAKRSGNETRIEQAWQVRKLARRELTAAIRKAKTTAWEEALADLDRDPWGRPYKAIIKN